MRGLPEYHGKEAWIWGEEESMAIFIVYHILAQSKPPAHVGCLYDMGDTEHVLL